MVAMTAHPPSLSHAERGALRDQVDYWLAQTLRRVTGAHDELAALIDSAFEAIVNMTNQGRRSLSEYDVTQLAYDVSFRLDRLLDNELWAVVTRVTDPDGNYHTLVSVAPSQDEAETQRERCERAVKNTPEWKDDPDCVPEIIKVTNPYVLTNREMDTFREEPWTELERLARNY